MNLKKLSWITLFSIAMGYMETIIVIYLRKIYYPGGFDFPLVSIDKDILAFEICRETATVIMLLSIGFITVHKASEKFAVFIYCFGIWDISFYIFLKLLINWPGSVITPDLLFLIPFPWIGPVLAPCIISFSMIAVAGCIFYFAGKKRNTKIHMKEWILFTTGSVTVIISFLWDYLRLILHASGNSDIPNYQNGPINLDNFIPGPFNWYLFLIGLVIIFIGITIFTVRMKNKSDH